MLIHLYQVSFKIKVKKKILQVELFFDSDPDAITFSITLPPYNPEDPFHPTLEFFIETKNLNLHLNLKKFFFRKIDIMKLKKLILELDWSDLMA